MRFEKTMKTKLAALALLLMAGAAPAALAQPDGQGGPRQERGERPDHPHGEGRPAPQARPQQASPQQAPPQQAPPQQAPMQRAWRPAQPPPAPPQAYTPPAAPQAHETRSYGGGQHRQDGGPHTYTRRPGRWVDTEGDDTSQGLSPADRADHEDRQELRDWRRFNGGRVPGVEDPRRLEPQRPDRRPDARRPGDRVREGDRHTPEGYRGDHDRRDGDRRDGDRRWDHDRGGQDRDRDRHGRPEWRPGVYPHSFHSGHRYRVRPYIRPPHYYIHVWNFGEFLPPAWYGPEYVLDDWWAYDLPAPPYGYVWVRVGDDALLIDDYSGRIVQIVRGLFW